MKRLKTGIEEARKIQLESRAAFGLPAPALQQQQQPDADADAEGTEDSTKGTPLIAEGQTESSGGPVPEPIPSSDTPPAPAPKPEPILLPSLQTLKTTIRSSAPPSSSSFALGGSLVTPQARTLQSLTSLTAYISSQMYASGGGRFNYSSYGVGGGGVNGQSSNPAAEEMRREIKALKGLVLNRYVFC